MATSSMDVDQSKPDPHALLDRLSSAPEQEVRSAAENLRGLYDRKLWYQLTLALESFLSLPASAPYQIDLFRDFVRDFEKHLNQLRLVDLGIRVAQRFTDGHEALAFLDALAAKVGTPGTQEAYVLAVMEAAHYRLLLGELDETKTAMTKCGKILDSFDSVDKTVHAAFYRVSGDYHKAKADYGDYYRTSLLYLACVDVETDLNEGERKQRAQDLALAALLSESIYNFGELLMHPILASLNGTPHEWVKQLLFVFNEGAIGKFEALAPQFPKEPILEQARVFLRQKICLMALIEAVFKRPAGNRIIPFVDIASETRLPEHEVEHLVMKALSLKLIQGSLDQVARTAQVTWVQPRVLDRAQIEGLTARLEVWSARVGATGEFARSVAGPELAVA